MLRVARESRMWAGAGGSGKSLESMSRVGAASSTLVHSWRICGLSDRTEADVGWTLPSRLTTAKARGKSLKGIWSRDEDGAAFLRLCRIWRYERAESDQTV
jgi:hypothetical protein